MESDGDGDELNNEEDEPESDNIACHVFTQKLLRRLERNDPSISGLTVTSIGWIRGAGTVFAQCQFLKRLHILLDPKNHWFAELCTGIACNQTIEDLLLHFGHGSRHDGCIDAFGLIAPFLRNNFNLRSFEVICNFGDPSTNLESLTSIFKGRKSGLLKKIYISWSDASDEEAAALVESLGGQHNLRHLCFKTTTVDRMVCKSLGSLMENPECKVHTLHLGGEISADCFAILCFALTMNSTLQHLDLRGIYGIHESNHSAL